MLRRRRFLAHVRPSKPRSRSKTQQPRSRTRGLLRTRRPLRRATSQPLTRTRSTTRTLPRQPQSVSELASLSSQQSSKSPGHSRSFPRHLGFRAKLVSHRDATLEFTLEYAGPKSAHPARIPSSRLTHGVHVPVSQLPRNRSHRQPQAHPLAFCRRNHGTLCKLHDLHSHAARMSRRTPARSTQRRSRISRIAESTLPASPRTPANRRSFTHDVLLRVYVGRALLRWTLVRILTRDAK